MVCGVASILFLLLRGSFSILSPAGLLPAEVTDVVLFENHAESLGRLRAGRGLVSRGGLGRELGMGKDMMVVDVGDPYLYTYIITSEATTQTSAHTGDMSPLSLKFPHSSASSLFKSLVALNNILLVYHHVNIRYPLPCHDLW